jgi:2-hydroxy-6-oxonona-2,4-dienedioate hydrolase
MEPMARNRIRTIAWVVVGAIVVALSVTTTFYQRDIQQARERVASGSQMAQTPCGPIEYAVVGDGPPVLVVHGAGGGFDQGLDIARPLTERGFRVIAVSRFGYLRTPLPADASPAAQADAHACLLDALGLQRVAVFGASAGAPSSMQLALRHPQRIRALMLLVPATYVPRPGGAPSVTSPRGMTRLMDIGLRSDFLFWAMARLARATMIRAILGTPPALEQGVSPAEQVRLQMMLDHIQPISQRRVGLLNEAVVVPSLQRYALERINVPTLTISFADDLYGTYDGARYTAEQIRGARFLGYPTGGHMGVGHQQDAFNEITRFLK